MKKLVAFFPVIVIILTMMSCNAQINEKQNTQKHADSISTKSNADEPANDELDQELKRFSDLTQSLQEKFEAGEIEEAKSSINELEKLLPEFEDNWNYGNAVHKINIVSGRIALQEGNIEEAKMYLLAAGRTKGSPQLDSFGPNMTLAKELLEKGEKEIVLQYFDLCSDFWKMGQSQLNKWKEIVKKGDIPDFGANLKY